tara:strand:+ start:1363 stop:1674 length:312 start_codon:yes stop_codon:yes gene_type:complete
MNGKGSKQRVRWSKDYEDNYNRIFKKKKKENKMKKEVEDDNAVASFLKKGKGSPLYNDKNNKYDNCVMCGAKTEYTKDTHIDFRANYVEGAGQMCNGCHTKIY